MLGDNDCGHNPVPTPESSRHHLATGTKQQPWVSVLQPSIFTVILHFHCQSVHLNSNTTPLLVCSCAQRACDVPSASWPTLHGEDWLILDWLGTETPAELLQCYNKVMKSFKDGYTIIKNTFFQKIFTVIFWFGYRFIRHILLILITGDNRVHRLLYFIF